MTLGGSQNYRVVVSEYQNYNIISFENKVEIDLYNIAEVAQIFKDGNRRGIEDWAIDLKPIKFIDSSGFSGIIAQSLHLAKRNKMLILISPPNTVLPILNTMNDTRLVFRIVADKSML